MPDVYDPISTQNTTAAALETLSDLMTDLAARVPKVGLYKTNIVPTATITLADIAEADFAGYARQALGAMSGPHLDSQKNAYSNSALLTFAASGGDGNTVFGSFLVANITGGVLATATNAGDTGAYDPVFTITNAGSRYQVAPVVHLTGATGSGASAHAVIVDGAVTAIVLDDPGSDYTTYIVAIDPPQELIQIAPLSATGISMSLATDALPTYVQLTMPSLNIQNP